MPISPEIIHGHLVKLPQRCSLDAALELFDTLGYQYADELPLPVRNWSVGVQRLVRNNAESPIYLAQHRDFRIVYTHLTTDALSRTVERPIVEQTLHKLHPYALFVFANQDLTLWDFVNVKYSEDGARRRTIRRIHVGPAERLHTAAQRVALLAVPAPEASALELQSLHDQAFDVEEVTRQFYRDYVQVFGQLCNDIARRNPRRKAQAETEAQVLLDRFMFLYFIQKKGWLDGQRDYLYHHFRARYQAHPEGTDFYSDFLFPLFVALSNEGTALPSLGDVPFLNGGLFEVPAATPLADQLVVGNAVFRQAFDDLLERYNFTVREDTPLDVEVAIDPEMLGQVFENLVLGLERGLGLSAAEGKDRRKATGSYYTPRVIVHFMCRQAFKEYLAAESGLDPARIEALMDAGPAEQLTPEEVAELAGMITGPEARLSRGLVEGARALDPAVGSGAFLVGMLYEMVALTKLLDVRLYGQQRVQRRNYNYDLKRRFIERGLYGVDIQPEAARICELRLWLSLMVDYERQAGEAVPTLPNLSYHVRVGDSLIERLFGEPVQLDQLADDAVARQLVDRIQTEKQAYFKEPDLAEKQRHELRILGLLCRLAARLVGAKRGAVLTQMSAQVPPMGEAYMSREQRKLKGAFEAELARYADLMERVKGVYDKVQAMQSGEVPIEARDVGALHTQLGLSFLWRLDFAEVFAEKGGFDVVVANPPYVTFGLRGSKRAAKEWADTVRQLYPGSAEYKISVYTLFLDLALRIARRHAVVCYITPDSFLLGRYFSEVRRTILDKAAIKKILMFERDFWKSGVVGRPTILLLQRDLPDQSVTAVLCEDEDALTNRRVWQHTYTQDYFETLPHNRFRLFFSPKAMDFVKAVEAGSKPLKRVARITTGVRSKSSQKNIIATQRRGPKWKKGIISGSQVTPYRVEWKGHYLHIDRDLLFAGGWDPSIVERPKIMIRQTGDTIIAAIDYDHLYHLNNVHSLSPLKPDISLPYLCAILNSQLMNRYYHLISLEYGRAMAQTDIETLELLPLREADSRTIQQIETLVAAIDDPASQDELERILENLYDLKEDLVEYLRGDDLYPETGE